jgi:hypothetical protein
LSYIRNQPKSTKTKKIANLFSHKVLNGWFYVIVGYRSELWGSFLFPPKTKKVVALTFLRIILIVQNEPKSMKNCLNYSDNS